MDEKVLEKVSEDGYFTKDKKSKKTGEEAFFKQGEKPEVSCQPSSRGNVSILVTDWFDRRRRSRAAVWRTRSPSTRLCWPTSRRNPCYFLT